jgi:hypothetical protein
VTDNGPFETEDEARMTPAVRAIYDAMRSSGLTDAEIAATDAMRTALITDACDAAGVTLGAYDQRIAAWMGNWEPQTCQVIAGLIARAFEAGRQPEPGTVTEWAVRYRHPSSPFPRHRIQPYPDEDMAREAAAEVRELDPGEEATVMYHQVGPWKEAPDA